MNTAMQLMPLILLIFIMYFLLIRPQKKREKATTQMRNTLQVGDEVITIGGVCGKIVKVKDETLIIQVGAEKVKFEVMRWAISKVVNSDPSAAAKKAKTSTENAAEETPKKVFPKKMGKKPEESEAGSATDAESVTGTESAADDAKEEVIDIPAEDVKILDDKNN